MKTFHDKCAVCPGSRMFSASVRCLRGAAENEFCAGYHFTVPQAPVLIQQKTGISSCENRKLLLSMINKWIQNEYKYTMYYKPYYTVHLFII